MSYIYSKFFNLPELAHDMGIHAYYPPNTSAREKYCGLRLPFGLERSDLKDVKDELKMIYDDLNCKVMGPNVHVLTRKCSFFKDPPTVSLKSYDNLAIEMRALPSGQPRFIDMAFADSVIRRSSVIYNKLIDEIVYDRKISRNSSAKLVRLATPLAMIGECRLHNLKNL